MSYAIRQTARIALGITALLAAMVAQTSGTFAATGTCSPTKIKFRTVTASADTMSTNFVAMPQTKFNFTQGGSTASCVIVHFTAEIGVEDAGTMIIVRAVLDSATVGDPGAVRMSGMDNQTLGARGMIFVFPSVAPGVHSIGIQYRSGQTNKAVVAETRTLIVQYK
jgi:hypothetical protein